MPARPEAGLVLVQPHVALLRLELGLNAPSGACHTWEGLQGSVLRSFGQVVAALAAVQVSAVDDPVDFARLQLTGRAHPLGAELVAAGPRLPSATVISRQAFSGNSSPRSAMVRRGVTHGVGRSDWSNRAPAAHRLRMFKPRPRVLLKTSYDCVIVPGGFSEKPLHCPG